MAVVIREDMEQYMRELREWLEQEKDTPLEEMAGFFSGALGLMRNGCRPGGRLTQESPAG